MSARGDGRLRRVTTGVPGLDEVLNGGFFSGAVYILRGAPGAGKTILANQICFHHAAEAGRALFVTLLSESHARMLQHMESMEFFDATAIPRSLYLVSAFRVLEEEGLKGLMDLLHREMRAHEASFLVLDGLIAVEETSASDREFRKFIHELQGHAAISDCAVLLLTNGSRPDHQPEHTMVDGLIEIADIAYGRRRERELEILKFRGSRTLRGRHSFRITDAGLSVFPRIESRSAKPISDISQDRMSTGISDLDKAIGGGVICGTTTVVIGSPGCGKTTVGMHFLNHSDAGEPGLHFGFYEAPERLLANAANLGLDLQTLVDSGHLEVLWHAPSEQILDELGNRLLQAVQRRKVKRLLVDGLGGFVTAAEIRERLPAFFAWLSNELRAMNVTTVYTVETQNFADLDLTLPIEGLSAITENLLLFRRLEFEGSLYRVLSALKVRGSDFDPRVLEFCISSKGVVLESTPQGAAAIMSSFGRRRRRAGDDVETSSNLGRGG
jgi:circadian clock protein KaiC